MAVCNGERYLASAINSVLAQDYHPLEVIVVDGPSKDKTAEIAQSFAEVHYIRQHNKGVANAYNLGIETATGEFIAFLSHDDLWTPDKLQVQVSYMLDQPQLQYTTAKIRFFLEPGYAIPPGFRPELLLGEHIGHIMETLVARRSLFEIVGTFNPQLSTAEDVDWFARAKDYAIPTAVIPKVLLHKRVHDTNLSLNTRENNRNLMNALKQSITRKRNQSAHDPHPG
jgi:glycosyltransferase involved in cell wall biosynthesis